MSNKEQVKVGFWDSKTCSFQTADVVYMGGYRYLTFGICLPYRYCHDTTLVLVIGLDTQNVFEKPVPPFRELRQTIPDQRGFVTNQTISGPIQQAHWLKRSTLNEDPGNQILWD